MVEFFNCLNKTDVAFLNQIEEMHTSADIALCDADNKTQICLGKALFRLLVAFHNALGKLYFLIARKQRNTSDFLKIHFDGIVD